MSALAFGFLLLAVIAVCAVVGVQMSNALDTYFMRRYFPDSVLSDDSTDGPRPAPAAPLNGAGREADQ